MSKRGGKKKSLAVSNGLWLFSAGRGVNLFAATMRRTAQSTVSSQLRNPRPTLTQHVHAHTHRMPRMTEPSDLSRRSKSTTTKASDRKKKATDRTM